MNAGYWQDALPCSTCDGNHTCVPPSPHTAPTFTVVNALQWSPRVTSRSLSALVVATFREVSRVHALATDARAALVRAAQLERSRWVRVPEARASACSPTSVTRAPGRARVLAPPQYTANMSRLLSLMSVPGSQVREVMEVQVRNTSSIVWRGLWAVLVLPLPLPPALWDAGLEADVGDPSRDPLRLRRPMMEARVKAACACGVAGMQPGWEGRGTA